MIFWDTSAIVPLLVQEPASQRIQPVLEEDPAMVVWWGTRLECLSALARREREGGLSHQETEGARKVLEALQETWTEVLATEEVRGHASRLLFRHALRAADSLQVGAALTWAAGRPDGHQLATLDERLGHAARGEGFSLLLDLLQK